MALGCSVAGPLVKSVSPISCVSRVVSTTTKLSDEIDLRLTASAGAPPGPSRPLLRRSNRSRISGHHGGVEAADIDPELERIRGHHRAHVSSPEPAFDFTPAVREVATSIPANPFGGARDAIEVVLQIGR